MKNTKFFIKTHERKYPVYIGVSSIAAAKHKLKSITKNSKNVAFFLDTKISINRVKEIIRSLKGKKISIFKITANEKNKNFVTANNLLNGLARKKFNRSDCVIAIGGGIVGDISGFVASTYKRGMKFINIPTTLLSQVDACIGGKTGVNSKFGKNLIGNFYQPNLVISDIQFLKTLPKREIICGYGEILKHSLIANKNFYNFLNKNSNKILKLSTPFIEKSIYESCKIKKNVVEKDEKEKGLRKILNFGHTFAHAYEASLGYSKKLNHGEAVILGIKTALKFSLKKNILKKNEYVEIINHISNLNFQSSINKFFNIKDLNKILKFMLKDKKNNSDKINLILLKKIGSPIINKKYSRNTLNLFLKNELIN